MPKNDNCKCPKCNTPLEQIKGKVKIAVQLAEIPISRKHAIGRICESKMLKTETTTLKEIFPEVFESKGCGKVLNWGICGETFLGNLDLCSECKKENTIQNDVFVLQKEELETQGQQINESIGDNVSSGRSTSQPADTLYDKRKEFNVIGEYFIQRHISNTLKKFIEETKQIILLYNVPTADKIDLLNKSSTKHFGKEFLK